MFEDYFLKVSRSGVAKQKKIYVAKQRCHMRPKSRKLENFENIDAGEGFGHENRPNFFAGANFIASRGRGSSCKCLVEWLHRREIAPAGAIAHTMALVQSGTFRSLDRIFVFEKDESRKSFETFSYNMFEFYFLKV